MSAFERMSARELRSALALASIFGLRMLGMFIILPVFALYALTLDGGAWLGKGILGAGEAVPKERRRRG